MKYLFAKTVQVLGLVACFAMPTAASAVAIPSGALIGASPASAGTGLSGSFWDTNVTSNNAANDSGADYFISHHTANTTFLSPVQNYGNHSSVNDGSYSVGSYLTSFGSTILTGASYANSVTIDSSLFRFTGYINITSAMDTAPGGTIDVNFMVGSDDGMRLNIGGVTVTEANYARGFSYSSGTASFSSAGLYAIELLYWENGGGTGLDMQWQTGSNGWTNVQTSNLYTTDSVGNSAPEPATLALLGLGGLSLLRRRRAR